LEEFSSGDHTIIAGDSVTALKTRVPQNCANLIFCDPPYNIGKDFNGRKDKWHSTEDYLAWCYEWLDLCLEKLRPDGSLYLMAATQFMPFLDVYLQKRVTILSRIVWYYDSSGVQARRYFGSLYEPILHCVKDPNSYTFNASSILVEAPTGAHRKLIDYRKSVPTQYNSQKVPGNVWMIPRVRYRMPEYEEHPTQKPIALLERIVLASSNPGDLILDPFAGAFTASYAAMKNGRKSLAIELDQEYVKIGLRRLMIMNEFKGETLTAPTKTYKTRKRSVANGPSLFESQNDTPLY
jgi:adenine-specific DNA-methyltransferase